MPPLRMFKPGGMNGPSTPEATRPDRGAASMGDDTAAAGGKMDSESAGYMELEGATKDADCSKVEVEGGVSSEKGNCHEFEPKPGAQGFSCGECSMLTGGAKPAGAEADETGNSQPVISGQPS